MSEKIKKKKTKMRTQLPENRIDNFREVASGYSNDEAVKEASRCLQCKNAPCISGCPVEIDIPGFISYIADSKFDEAAGKVKEKNNLPGVCGRVCPQENQCEELCNLRKMGEPVAIGGLERFTSDWELQKGTKNPRILSKSGFKVAVIGSGPSSLSAAGELAILGHSVTIFEALHEPGGVLTYGIPEFRLPKDIVRKEIGYIRSLGVEIKTNSVIAGSHTIDDLLEEEFDAVFIGTGAGSPTFLGIPGENFNNVYSANEFLTRTNLMHAYDFPDYDTPIKVGKRTAVIGAGNVAMDAARTSLRLGSEEVYIVYRRTREEMPAREEEIRKASEEGVHFKLLTSPVEIRSSDTGEVNELISLSCELGEPDKSGRRKPIAIKESEFSMPVETVIVAIGQGINPLVAKSTSDLELNSKGTIAVDEDGRTSKEGVFAGGDVITGAATVILAMGTGKKAAHSIDKYLKNKY